MGPVASPIVSFVVPCYNYGRFLGQALDSILNQSLDALEVIVVDDASTDDTEAAAAKYAGDPRVRLIRHTHNQGHIHSYNEGLLQARGTYVGLVSADDYVARPDAVARQVEHFERYPNVGLVYTAHELVDGGGQCRSISRPWDSDYVASGLDEFKRLVWLNYVPAGGTLVRRTVHDDLGWYDVGLPHAADWDLWLRVLTRYDVAYIAEPLYAYRLHESNMSSTRITPGQAMDELLLVLERNFLRLPSPLHAELMPLWKPARRRALFVQLWNELGRGRARRAWHALAGVIRRSPQSLFDPTLYSSGMRVLALTVLGPARYHSLYGGFGV